MWLLKTTNVLWCSTTASLFNLLLVTSLCSYVPCGINIIKCLLKRMTKSMVWYENRLVVFMHRIAARACVHDVYIYWKWFLGSSISHSHLYGKAMLCCVYGTRSYLWWKHWIHVWMGYHNMRSSVDFHSLTNDNSAGGGNLYGCTGNGLQCQRDWGWYYKARTATLCRGSELSVWALMYVHTHAHARTLKDLGTRLHYTRIILSKSMF